MKKHFKNTGVEVSIINLTQNDRLKRVTSDTLIVRVDVGTQTHFYRADDWKGFELSGRVFKFSNAKIELLDGGIYE